jgi:hypothetical protein
MAANLSRSAAPAQSPLSAEVGKGRVILPRGGQNGKRRIAHQWLLEKWKTQMCSADLRIPAVGRWFESGPGSRLNHNQMVGWRVVSRLNFRSGWILALQRNRRQRRGCAEISHSRFGERAARFTPSRHLAA